MPGGSSTVPRSEEHTSELQSRFDLVCRLLLEKKNKNTTHAHTRAASHFYHAPATTAIYTLSLHDALPIYRGTGAFRAGPHPCGVRNHAPAGTGPGGSRAR